MDLSLIEELFALDVKPKLKCTSQAYEKLSGTCLRDRIMNWVAQRAQQFQFNLKTLELAIIYIDMYLNTYMVGQKYLELMAACALTLAAKFNETSYFQQIRSQTQEGVDLYREEEYQNMERQIITMLKYQTNWVTTSDYLSALHIEIDDSIHSLLVFIQLDSEFASRSSFQQALAIICLSQQIKLDLNKDVFEYIRLIQQKLISSLQKVDPEVDSQRTIPIQRKIKKIPKSLKAKC